MAKTTLITTLFLFCLTGLGAQDFSTEEIIELITSFKDDPRGPYKEIRWYCDDGSVIGPKESCPEPGGVQRASYKNEVLDLARSQNIFLGQILSTTDNDQFWDASNNHSRLKQYHLENYLKNIDNGWVNRKAQFYRGAYQIEDEVAWGLEFFNWLLSSKTVLEDNFFLTRQSAKVIPHNADSDLFQRIRSLSKVISDDYTPFMDLRIKIHGQPDASDIQSVVNFQKEHEAKMKKAQLQNIQTLVEDMSKFYAPVDITSLSAYLKKIPTRSSLYQDFENYLAKNNNDLSSSEIVTVTAELMLAIRKGIGDVGSRRSSLALLDLSNALEEILFKNITIWKAESIEEKSKKIYASGMAATGAGFLELWEWESLSPRLQPQSGNENEEALRNYLVDARRLVEWAAGMTRAVYQDVIDLYRPFEPKAYGFIDNLVRSSVLLDLGNTVGDYGEQISSNLHQNNYLLGISNASHARGLNPGVAMGELQVLESTSEDMEVDKNKIYVFHRPPSDLKPVAGIATVTEGNIVSHVQLLARNLAIPNAVISDQNFEELKSFSGRNVFYVVAPSGQVSIKAESEMNEKERARFVKGQRNQERIKVPVDQINFAQTKVLDMRAVDASSSGKLCGPKAANLGQLKAIFPEHVVEGLVIPFGIFRNHMDKDMPRQDGSYWDFLNQTFGLADQLRQNGMNDDKIENFVLEELATLREAIINIEFDPEFVNDLKTRFTEVFGERMGKVPVFLRSDTNMEDLKDFTGAGLNLTLFNIVDDERILQGIKEVWASPYKERSFKWRQRYLLNPENVFPSILIIPSVDVDFSGVLITKGISSDLDEDLTLAISRGAGGAVDGQAAEAYLLKANGSNRLLTPAREPSYRRLPARGGTSNHKATFEQPIANIANLDTIRSFAKVVESVFPDASGTESGMAYDIEFGFKDDKLWLFQIRPFVENKETLEDPAPADVAVDATPDQRSPVSLWWIFALIAAVGVAAIILWKNKPPSIKTSKV